MSNWVDVHLDVLASSSKELNDIEQALQNACADLIAWHAKRARAEPKEIEPGFQEIATFKPIRNLGYVDLSINKARRFENSWKDKFSSLVWSHVHFVSRDFPKAVFLAQYSDDMMSYGGKVVIHAGKEICHSHDGNHQAPGEWVLLNIFAPFWAEYELGLEVGSLWKKWLEGMQKELADMQKELGELMGRRSPFR